jgi:uncharacterized protein (TIGR03382 family)
VEHRLSAPAVVAIWGIANAALIAVLIGFTAARSGPGLDIVLYCASATLVFALALLAWLARRRHWLPMAAVAPLTAALIMEIAVRRSSRG